MARNWSKTDELVGRVVEVWTDWSESETGTIVAVAMDGTGTVMVRSHEDGETLVGNVWDDVTDDYGDVPDEVWTDEDEVRAILHSHAVDVEADDVESAWGVL